MKTPTVKYQRRAGGWFWVLTAANGRKVSHASGYDSKAGARRAFRALPRIASTAKEA